MFSIDAVTQRIADAELPVIQRNHPQAHRDRVHCSGTLHGRTWRCELRGFNRKGQLVTFRRLRVSMGPAHRTMLDRRYRGFIVFDGSHALRVK